MLKDKVKYFLYMAFLLLHKSFYTSLITLLDKFLERIFWIRDHAYFKSYY